jgi:uncharacterized protein RhaS with RHS repeats
LIERICDKLKLVGHAAQTSLPSPLSNPTMSVSNNRVDGCGYDTAGNVTTDLDGKTFGYDAENKMTTFNGGSTSGVSSNGASYFYDGDGRRVKKIVSGVTTSSVYNAGGQMLAEYSDSPGAGPGGGAGGTSYVTSDTLGTPRVIIDSNGNVKSRHDYQPFGEEIGWTGGRSSNQGYNINDGESSIPAGS